MKKTKFMIVIVSSIFMLSTIYFLSNERNRAAWGSSGYIESGEKFEITIGENKTEVTAHLTALGLIDVSTVGSNETHFNPLSCHGHTYDDKFVLEVWRDNSWRRGIICVAFKDEVLERMSWNYGMFQS